MITTREQDCVIENLALDTGRVHIARSRMAQEDGWALVTVPSGSVFAVSPEGNVSRRGWRHDIEWEAA